MNPAQKFLSAPTWYIQNKTNVFTFFIQNAEANLDMVYSINITQEKNIKQHDKTKNT